MLAPGDRMPFCAGMAADRQFYSFDAQAGRSAVLVLVLGAALGSDVLDPLILALAGRRDAMAALQTDLVVMLGFAAGPTAWHAGPGAASGAMIVLCQDEFFDWCGMPPGVPMVVVIDRASRVVAGWIAQNADPSVLAEVVMTALTQIEREPAGHSALPAPVLAVPGLFDAGFCAELIASFEAGDNFDSGVSSLGPDGKPIDRLNHDKKRRRDWMLQPADPIHSRVLDHIFRRCAPDIKRAFQCDVAHADRVLIARYDETGGYFRRHRDNVGETVAFRQFALSVNLNAGYQGGDLLFPEFNDHRYCPPTGAGLLFSTALLHEATPVTKGARYVLLTFLHDAKAEARRVAVLEAIGKRAQASAVAA